jgi:hypothetical protein
MDNGGYASPGSTMPAPGMGFSTPGFFQAGLGAAGFGAPPHQRYADQVASQAQLGSLGGDAAANFLTSTLPGAVGAGVMIGGAGAPILHAMGKGTGRAWLGALGTAFDAVDPFTYAFSGAKMGFRGGVTLAGRGAALAAGGITQIGARGLVAGAMGALTVGAAPLALAAGATLATGYALEQMSQGNQQYQATKQFLVNQGSSLFGTPINPMGGMASDMRQIFHSGARSLRTDDETVREITRFLGDQGYFKTVSSMKEFREKFDKALSTIKTIAKEMQTTIEDATNTFGQIRQQGFYQVSDIGQQALRQGALAAATGREQSQVAAMGAYGAQMARQYGMRGRFGAEFAQNVQAAVDMGLRNGSLDEETVMENGGPEAVAARLAQVQMRFLKGSRGRMMMANAMQGGSSEYDTRRLEQLLGGSNSLSDLVQGAVNRGLGTLYRTGGAEAQQNFMQFAGMAMVNSVVSERQMLGLSTDRAGLIQGLRQQGRSADEASMLLAQVANLGNVVGEQRAQESLAQQRKQFDELSSRYSIISRTKSTIGGVIVAPAQAFGAGIGEEMDQQAASWGEWWSGRRERQVGGVSRAYLQAGGKRIAQSGEEFFVLQGDTGERGRAWWAVPTLRERFRDEYSDYRAKVGAGIGNMLRNGVQNWTGREYDLRDGQLYDKEGNLYSYAGKGEYIRADAPEIDFRMRQGEDRRDVSEAGAARLQGLAETGRLTGFYGTATSAVTEQVAGGMFGRVFGLGPGSNKDRMVFGVLSSLPAGDEIGDEIRKMSLEEYSRLPAWKKAQYEGAVRRAVPEDTLDGRRVRYALGSDKTAAFSTVAGARRVFADTMNAILDEAGMGEGWLFNGADELRTALERSDKYREAFTTALGNVSSGDEMNVRDAIKSLEDSGLTGQALRQAKELLGYVAFDTTDKERAKFASYQEELQGAGGALAVFGLVERSKNQTRDVWQKIQEGPDADDYLKGVYGEFAGAARDVFEASGKEGLKSYETAFEGLALQMAPGGISRDEIELLVRTAGGHSGARDVAQDVNDLIDKDKRQAALERFGYSGRDLSDMMALDATALLQRVMSERKLLPAMYGEGKGRDTVGGLRDIEGTEAEAWVRQAQFVSVVDKFMTKFKGTEFWPERAGDTLGEHPASVPVSVL